VDGRVVFDSTKRTDETRPLGTAGTWILSVDDDRWRALVELLLPPGEIANTSREDEVVGGQLDRSRRRPA
jgi:hypothetical protein